MRGGSTERQSSSHRRLPAPPRLLLGLQWLSLSTCSTLAARLPCLLSPSPIARNHRRVLACAVLPCFLVREVSLFVPGMPVPFYSSRMLKKAFAAGCKVTSTLTSTLADYRFIHLAPSCNLFEQSVTERTLQCSLCGPSPSSSHAAHTSRVDTPHTPAALTRTERARESARERESERESERERDLSWRTFRAPFSSTPACDWRSRRCRKPSSDFLSQCCTCASSCARLGLDTTLRRPSHSVAGTAHKPSPSPPKRPAPCKIPRWPSSSLAHPAAAPLSVLCPAPPPAPPVLRLPAAPALLLSRMLSRMLPSISHMEPGQESKSDLQLPTL